MNDHHRLYGALPPIKPAHKLGFAYPPNTEYQLVRLTIRPNVSYHSHYGDVSGVRYLVMTPTSYRAVTLADAVRYHAVHGLACPIVRVHRTHRVSSRGRVDVVAWVRPDSMIDWSRFHGF